VTVLAYQIQNVCPEQNINKFADKNGCGARNTAGE
jgi:hypothetical protein